MKPRIVKHDPEVMGKESIGRLLLRFSLPAITAMLVQAIYNIVDRIYIGHFASLAAFNGIYIAFPIMMGLLGISMLFAIGGSSLFSIRLGEGDRKGAMRLLGNTTMLLIISSLVITIIGLIFTKPLLYMFGASAETIPHATAYMRIIFGGNIFMMVAMGVNNFLRAEGKATIAMVTMLIGALSNIFLDYIFIVVLGWGASGAATATVIARVISASWIMYYYFSGRTSIPLVLSMMKLKWNVFVSIVLLGVSSFFQQISMVVMLGVANNVLKAYGGETAISAIATIFSIMSLIHLPLIGIAQGAQPIFGFNYGAKKFERLKKTLIITGVVAVSIGIIGLMVVQFLPVALTSLFISKSSENAMAVIDTTSKAMPIFLMMLPLTSLQIIGVGYFRSIGKVWYAMSLGMLRQLFLFIPLIILLPITYGIDGAWFAGPVADTLAFLVTIILLIVEIRKLSNIGQTKVQHRNYSRAYSQNA
jgi:putative MATE family efflux protein